MFNSWKFMFINIRGAKNILLNFELNFEQFLAKRFPRSSAAHICTCTQQLPPPSREATGVFRAATGVAAAPRRGANPPFATEELGVGLPMYVYVTYLFCLNMSKITFA